MYTRENNIKFCAVAAPGFDYRGGARTLSTGGGGMG